MTARSGAPPGKAAAPGVETEGSTASDRAGRSGTSIDAGEDTASDLAHVRAALTGRVRLAVVVDRTDDTLCAMCLRRPRVGPRWDWCRDCLDALTAGLRRRRGAALRVARLDDGRRDDLVPYTDGLVP